MISLNLFTFTDFVPDSGQRYNMGYLMLCENYLMIGINIVTSLRNIFIQNKLHLRLRMLYRKIKNKFSSSEPTQSSLKTSQINAVENVLVNLAKQGKSKKAKKKKKKSKKVAKKKKLKKKTMKKIIADQTGLQQIGNATTETMQHDKPP